MRILRFCRVYASGRIFSIKRAVRIPWRSVRNAMIGGRQNGIYTKKYIGILVCFGIAVPAWLLGKAFPIIGGPVLSILFGMLIALFWSDKGKAAADLCL